MPNETGYNSAIRIGSTMVMSRVTSIEYVADHAAIDVTDLGDWIDNIARGPMTLDVNAHTAYKSQSGLKWLCTLGAGYTGAEFESVGISWNNAEIETADAADTLSQRAAGPANVTIRGSARYNATNHFHSMLWTAASSNISLAMTVTDANGSQVIAGTMRVTNAGKRMDARAAVAQTFECKLLGCTAIGASAQFLQWAKAAASGAGTKTVKITAPGGQVDLSGTGTVLAATLNAARDQSVRETCKIGIHTINSMR